MGSDFVKSFMKLRDDVLDCKAAGGGSNLGLPASEDTLTSPLHKHDSLL